jgi:VTC domain
MIDELEPVSLGDVRASAALLARIERKYVVPMDELAAVVSRLAMPVLDIDGRRRFQYRSVYFDTPTWDTYRAAAYRRPTRVKVRTRGYVDAGTCMLEVKSKAGGRSRKERIEYDPVDVAVLTGDALGFLAIRTPELLGRGLSATLTTSYERWSFADLAAGVRVTVDTDVAFDDPTGRRATMPGVAIVETKSANGSCSADRLLWTAGYRPESISKYAFGVAALHPELPHNKWHRAVRRYVRTSEERRG